LEKVNFPARVQKAWKKRTTRVLGRCLRQKGSHTTQRSWRRIEKNWGEAEL